MHRLSGGTANTSGEERLNGTWAMVAYVYELVKKFTSNGRILG
jgi:hypothetical protein